MCAWLTWDVCTWQSCNWIHSCTTHRGDHTSIIWISRSLNFPNRSFEWRGLRWLKWNPVWNFGDFRENMFDVYGDSRENLWDILAVVFNLSLISSVRGMEKRQGNKRWNSWARAHDSNMSSDSCRPMYMGNNLKTHIHGKEMRQDSRRLMYTDKNTGKKMRHFYIYLM